MSKVYYAPTKLKIVRIKSDVPLVELTVYTRVVTLQ